MKLLLAFLGVMLVTSSARAQLTPVQMNELLQKIDSTMTVPSDFRLLWYMSQKSSSGEEKVWQVVVYRRDGEGSLLVMANKPHTEAGKGYLRTGNNLWAYDPGTGKWERRGDDRSFFTKSSRRRDFDTWRLAAEYDPTYVAKEKVGDVETHHLKLKLKKTVTWESDFPTWDLWVSTQGNLPIKVDQYADSGKLIRTVFYPKWLTKKDPKGKEIIIPQEMRMFDRVDEGTKTQVVLRDAVFEQLEPATFTKGWVESKAR